MNLERELEKVFFEILKLRVADRDWKRKNSLRQKVREIWDMSDLTAPELAEALEITYDELAYVLDPSCDFNRGRRKLGNVWEENFKAKLPLFIPIKITQL